MKKTIWVILALFFLIPVKAKATDPFRGPWDAGGRTAAPTAQVAGGNETTADALLIFYRKVISPLSPDRCTMKPSCSQYSHECFSRFGVVRGFVMTADRLVRCGRDEVRLGPRVWTGSGFRTLDPVAANDLWSAQ